MTPENKALVYKDEQGNDHYPSINVGCVCGRNFAINLTPDKAAIIAEDVRNMLANKLGAGSLIMQALHPELNLPTPVPGPIEEIVVK